MDEQWILVSVSTGASSTLRGHAWRQLRSLGALYLQQSVCLLPERRETTRAVARLIERLQKEGGEGRALRIALRDATQEAELIEALQAARDAEYHEFCSRTPAFLAEIDMERGRGRATYAEVEESEADLERLRKWLTKIEARDYFQARAGNEARAALKRCTTALTSFEAEAVTAEAGAPHLPFIAPPDPATTPRHLTRVRAHPGDTPRSA